jgi:hypothetical protein
MYDERFRTMVFRVVEDIKKIQSIEAHNNAQARQKALGYSDGFKSSTSSSSSTCSITMPLTVANNIFDRGIKEELQVQQKKKLVKNSNKTYCNLFNC